MSLCISLGTNQTLWTTLTTQSHSHSHNFPRLSQQPLSQQTQPPNTTKLIAKTIRTRPLDTFFNIFRGADGPLRDGYVAS